MHPIAKCCGYYCSCILAVGVVFFGILIGLIKSHNPWLTRGFSHDIDPKVDALIIAIIVNAVCFGVCVVCLVVGRFQEIKQRKLQEEQEEAQFAVQKNQ